MTPEEIAAKEAATAAAAEAEAKAKAEADSHKSPVELELEKAKKKGAGKTELEKALFTRQQVDRRIAELQKESGVMAPIAEDDEAPVTVGMLKKREQEAAAKNSLQLADQSIEDESERELVKHYLSNTLRPSGNPQEDLNMARSMVNAVKNKQLIDEAARKGSTKTYSSGTGAPAKPSEGIFEPTSTELAYMKAPFNLSKEDILRARKADQQ